MIPFSREDPQKCFKLNCRRIEFKKEHKINMEKFIYKVLLHIISQSSVKISLQYIEKKSLINEP